MTARADYARPMGCMITEEPTGGPVALILSQQHAAEQRAVAEVKPVPLATFSDASCPIGTAMNLASWMESVGRVPELAWYRGDDGLIAGVAVYEKTVRTS